MADILSNKTGDDGNDLGYFTTPAALEAAYPVGFPGAFAIVGSTNTIWVWDESLMTWVDTGIGSFAVIHDNTLTGNGTNGDPLGVVGATQYVTNWYPTDTKNGVNLIFTAKPGDTFILGTTQVYYQGQRQGLGVDYTEISNTQIQFITQTPASSDSLFFDYTKLVSVIPVVPSDELLLENGGAFLLETGFHLLLED